MPAPAGREQRHALLQPVHAGNEALGLGLQLAASVGQRHALGMAREQRQAEFDLQRPDLLAQRRLLHPQQGRGSRDVAAVGDRREVAQLTHVHM